MKFTRIAIVETWSIDRWVIVEWWEDNKNISEWVHRCSISLADDYVAQNIIDGFRYRCVFKKTVTEAPPLPDSVPLVERFWKGQWEPVKEWPQDAHLARWVEWCRLNQPQGCVSRTDWGGSTHRCVWSIDGRQATDISVTGNAWGGASAKASALQKMIEQAALRESKTLRDEFAIAALPEILSRFIGSHGGNPLLPEPLRKELCEEVYRIANAMMQERSKESVAATDMPEYPPIG